MCYKAQFEVPRMYARIAMNTPDMLVDFISLCQKVGHTGGLVVHASNSSTLKAEAG